MVPRLLVCLFCFVVWGLLVLVLVFGGGGGQYGEEPLINIVSFFTFSFLDFLNFLFY